eukprot:gene4164-3005_t
MYAVRHIRLCCEAAGLKNGADCLPMYQTLYEHFSSLLSSACTAAGIREEVLLHSKHLGVSFLWCFSFSLFSGSMPPLFAHFLWACAVILACPAAAGHLQSSAPPILAQTTNDRWVQLSHVLSAGETPRFGVSPIFCDGTNAVCPRHSPCCDGINRVRSTFCGPTEECCAVGGEATCCAPGSRCSSVRIDGAEKPFCEAENCTALQTADDCLQYSPQCGWCCEDQRCRAGNASCLSGRRPLTSMSERCPSPCHYYDTCAMCTGNRPDAAAERSERCAWCLSTSSCMPLSAAAQCHNGQSLYYQASCDLASYTVATGGATEAVIFTCLMYAIGIIVIAGAPAVLYHRGLLWEEGGLTRQARSSLQAQDGKGAHNRHRPPPAPPSLPPPLSPRDMTCACCGAPLMIAPSPSPTVADDAQQTPEEVPAITASTEQRPAGGDKTTDGHIQEEGAQQVQASAQPPEQGENKPASARATPTPPPDARGERNEPLVGHHFVALLPCQHLLCSVCTTDLVRDARWWWPVRRLRVVARRISRLVCRYGGREALAAAPRPHTNLAAVEAVRMPSREELLVALEQACPMCAAAIVDVLSTDMLRQL